MIYLRATSRENGYATPAAIVISLSLAIMAVAVSDRSLAALNLARDDLEKARAELALDGVQQEAALAVITALRAAPLQTSGNVDAKSVPVHAEPEAPKISLAAVVDLDDDAFTTLGVHDPESLRARLKALAAQEDDGTLEQLDLSPIWSRCARSLISVEGAANALQPINPSRQQGAAASGGRTGEVWRLRAGPLDGWIDDRTVRFTGDLFHPARIIRRRLFKDNRESAPCDIAFAQNAAR